MKNYKQILILLAITLLIAIVFPSGITLAQEINYCKDGTPTFDKISIKESVWVGSAGNINDEISTTYIGFTDKSGAAPSCSGHFAGIVDFGAAIPQIDRIEYNGYTSNSVGCSSRTSQIRVSVYDGTWQQIYYQSSGGTSYNFSNTLTGPWNNISQVSVDVSVSGGNCAYDSANCQARLYEIRAFGLAPPFFIDSGLRVYNSKISSDPIPIAAWPLGQEANSPMRIYKDTNIYGIALIDSTDPQYGDAQYDSGVRIQTDEGPMALRRYQQP